MDSEQASDVRAIVASSLGWNTLPDDVLAAAVAGATFDAKPQPRIRKENRAYQPARDLNLIAEDGTMHELVFRGLMHAAQRFQGGGVRMKAENEAEKYLLELAARLDRWAAESETGGWSTYQVRSQRKLAQEIRSRLIKGDFR